MQSAVSLLSPPVNCIRVETTLFRFGLGSVHNQHFRAKATKSAGSPRPKLRMHVVSVSVIDVLSSEYKSDLDMTPRHKRKGSHGGVVNSLPSCFWVPNQILEALDIVCKPTDS
jgi:hypothetical protein